jgi:hypothetical protein
MGDANGIDLIDRSAGVARTIAIRHRRNRCARRATDDAGTHVADGRGWDSRKRGDTPPKYLIVSWRTPLDCWLLGASSSISPSTARDCCACAYMIRTKVRRERDRDLDFLKRSACSFAHVAPLCRGRVATVPDCDSAGRHSISGRERLHLIDHNHFAGYAESAEAARATISRTTLRRSLMTGHRFIGSLRQQGTHTERSQDRNERAGPTACWA